MSDILQPEQFKKHIHLKSNVRVTMLISGKFPISARLTLVLTCRLLEYGSQDPSDTEPYPPISRFGEFPSFNIWQHCDVSLTRLFFERE